MIEPGLWTLLLAAAVLAVGLGWLAGRRGAAQLAQQVLLSEERQQVLQDRCDELQEERLQGQ
ncbi:TPA: DNA recombination protein RmuC, partial [Aeromonas hydrophila]